MAKNQEDDLFKEFESYFEQLDKEIEEQEEFEEYFDYLDDLYDFLEDNGITVIDSPLKAAA